jgi:hypothetical protein
METISVDELTRRVTDPNVPQTAAINAAINAAREQGRRERYAEDQYKVLLKYCQLLHNRRTQMMCAAQYRQSTKNGL